MGHSRGCSCAAIGGFPTGSADCPIDVSGTEDAGDMQAFGRRITSTAEPPRTSDCPKVEIIDPNCLSTGAMQWAHPSLSQLATRPR